ncbi:MAG: hypothetical protein MJ126_09135 [Lachnospiraceae bacterium]|nr:hypothetical protein [Lachnospiraceae bacterium]
MIDVENLVITKIREQVKTIYPDVAITSKITDVPSSFPCISIQEEDNSIYAKSQDATGAEYHAKVMYSVNVYSNKEQGNKAEAKDLMSVVDNAFRNIGFNRTMKSPVPNRDVSIYRITARYEAIVAESQEIGDDTVYQVYGR